MIHFKFLFEADNNKFCILSKINIYHILASFEFSFNFIVSNFLDQLLYV